MVHALKSDHRTLIMGVLNVTPDSFSDPGEHYEFEEAVEHALQMEEEGADIIDVGGESTRPGADQVPQEVELERVIPVIQKVRDESDIPISIDTYKSQVAKEAIKCGATIVNDISACRFDEDMKYVLAEEGASVILMHMQGNPGNMQDNPVYDDVVRDIVSFLEDRIVEVTNAGVPKENIIVDPGIGFGKTLEHNLAIIKRLSEFKVLGQPILLGTSRKSFIGQITGRAVKERLEGTITSNVIGVINGADLVRVHDVYEVKSALTVAEAILRGGIK